MKAKFQIQNVQDAEAALPMYFVFSQRGGLIGASEQANWQVQDIQGRMPDTAARVVVQEGRFTIEALGGAKIRINGASSAIPTGRPVIISDKDEVDIEGLRCTVSTEGDEVTQYETRNVQEMVGAGQAGADALTIDGELTHATVVEPQERVAEVAERMDPLDALSKSMKSKRHVDPLEAFSARKIEQASTTQAGLHNELEQPKASRPETTLPDQADMHFAAMPETNVKRDRYGFEEGEWPSSNPPRPQIQAATLEVNNSSVDHVALRPLSRRLGIPLGEMSTEQAHRVMADIGGSLRAALSGLNRIYRENDTREGNFPLATMHMHALEDNPIRFSPDIDSTLHAFFSKRGPVHLSAPAAVEESLEHLRCHQMATEFAIDRALDAVMTALLPSALERRFRAYDPDLEPEDREEREAWCWRMYRAYFSELRSQRQQGLQMLFWEVFSQEYQVSMRRQQMEKDLADEYGGGTE